jgi:hypothetical protein
VLCAYCPRWIVALPGQQSGSVLTVFENLTPSLAMLLCRAVIRLSVPGIWSSVSTKTMLGRALTWATPLLSCSLGNPKPMPRNSEINATNFSAFFKVLLPSTPSFALTR